MAGWLGVEGVGWLVEAGHKVLPLRFANPEHL